MRRFMLPCAVALFSFPASLCTAQSVDATDEPTENVALAPSNSQNLAPKSEVTLNFIDQKLALSLAVDTHLQIETAEFALKSISNEALRRLVAVRLEDHRAFAARLDLLTAGKAKQAIFDAIAEIEADKTAGKPRAVSFRPAALQRYATALLVRVRLEIMWEYETAVRGDLAGKSADEFDKQFMRTDVLRQLQLLAMLKVFQGQASPDFAEVIHGAWSTANGRFEISRALLVQLETAPLAGTTPVAGKLAESDGDGR